MMRPENATKAIDNLGRITLPKGLRDRLGLAAGTEMEFYTEIVGDREYVCLTPKIQAPSLEEELARAAELLRANGFEIQETMK